ncbi:MAG: penicillin-binding protein 2 [Pseudomonadota bacterium]|nr:penicillin-binding protein 2 [Pseudomonadota bacterium]
MRAHYVDSAEETREYQQRYWFLYVIVVFFFVIFCLRLWYLQIMRGGELRFVSEKNVSKKTTIAAPRGLFYDRDSRVLVENLIGTEAAIVPQYLQDSEKTIEAVALTLKLNPTQISNEINKSRRKNGAFQPVKIKENLSLEEVFKLRLMRIDHPALTIREVILRSYPLKENSAQLLGFVGEITKNQIPVLNKKYRDLKFRQGDQIGKRGLERFRDEEIRGKDGVQHFGVDARGRGAETLSQELLESIKKFNAQPLQGKNLYLTIDKDIQETAFSSFVGQKRIGGLVAMKNNGEVLAWVSSPSFDPNNFSSGMSSEFWAQLINDPYNPLTDKVIQYHSAPGSTFKTILALAGLQEKKISPWKTEYCTGSMRMGTRPYHCASKTGHGTVNMFQAIERSCNIYFFKLGILLGIDKIAEYAFALGLGKKTGIDLFGEIAGHVPTEAWKKSAIGEEWQLGETLSNSIGQGFVLSTPIQMAMAYATIANEGPMYRPFIVKKITDYQNHTIQEFQPTLISDLSVKQDNQLFIDKETFKTVKKGLWQVANGENGTARWWKIPGVEISGKTGTGQLYSFASSEAAYADCASKPLNQRHHGWFIGYAPPVNPEITVAILAEHSCHGSTGAAPIVRDVIKAYFEKYHPEMLKVAKPVAKATNDPKSEPKNEPKNEPKSEPKNEVVTE